MRIKVVAKNDRGIFAGLDEAGNYCVLSLAGVGEIDLKDILTGDFNQATQRRVYNATKREEVRVYPESWDCNWAVALDFLERLNSPTKIFTTPGHR